MKTVVLDGFTVNPGDLSWAPFEELGETIVYDRTRPEEVAERIGDAEAVLTNKVVLDAKTLRSLPNLKYIGVLATGYNVVDIAATKELGITVTNIPAYSTMSVAQRVFSLLLGVTDSVEHYALEVREGKWTRNPDFCFWDAPLTELAGKTFGIVGLGNIGMAVARIALAFGMKVLALTSKDVEELPDGVAKAGLDELLAASDVVSLHCPLTPSTEHLINRHTLLLMKPTAILINTGRGPLIDEAAVAEALREGRLAAFCGDVLSTEPPAADNPLLTAPRSLITPHSAWATLEARKRLMHTALNNLRAHLAGNPQNVVNR